MNKCKHAEEMLEYAKDAQVTNRPWDLWEVSVDEDEYGDYGWSSLSMHPTWHPERKYRRKPRTININRHEVPEPECEPLEMRTYYYVPSILHKDLHIEYRWFGDEGDESLLKKGLIHRAKGAAVAHAKALLSFTAEEQKDV